MSKRKPSVRFTAAVTGMALVAGCSTTVSGEDRPGGIVDAGRQFELTGSMLIRAAACTAINAKLGAVPVGNERYNNAAHHNNLPEVEVSRGAYIFDPAAKGWGQAFVSWHESGNVANYAAMYMAGQVDASNPFWQRGRLDSTKVSAMPEGMHVVKFSLWQSEGKGIYISRETTGVVMAHTVQGDFPINGADMQVVNNQAEAVIRKLNEHAQIDC